MHLEGLVDVANSLTIGSLSVQCFRNHNIQAHYTDFGINHKPKHNKGMDFLHMKKVCNISRSKTKTQQVRNHLHSILWDSRPAGHPKRSRDYRLH